MAAAQGFAGRGNGQGWRNQYHTTSLTRWQRGAFWNAPATAEDEKQELKSEAGFLRSRLQDIEDRLASMRSEKK